MFLEAYVVDEIKRVEFYQNVFIPIGDELLGLDLVTHLNGDEPNQTGQYDSYVNVGFDVYAAEKRDYATEQEAACLAYSGGAES